jgi:hypothetical protein
MSTIEDAKGLWELDGSWVTHRNALFKLLATRGGLDTYGHGTPMVGPYLPYEELADRE